MWGLFHHAPSCKKGSFVSLHQNHIRDLTANLLMIICHDVLIELTLQQLTGESLRERTAKITDEACVDICYKRVLDFWTAINF